uniref:Putative RdRp n=1 Tax=Leucoagaricus ourmiavirus F TaxID=2593998 RepID=A0A7G3W8S1_9VIRU|nr:putative RdRp [Leucoagaricus ourmiavirus F]
MERTKNKSEDVSLAPAKAVPMLWAKIRSSLRKVGCEGSLPSWLPSKGWLAENLKKVAEKERESTGSGVRRQNRELTGAASGFLFRKVIPGTVTKAQAEDAYLRSLGEKHRHKCGSDCRWKSDVRRKVEDLFPIGWDSRYEEYVERAYVGKSACLEVNAKKGGIRSWLAEQEFEEFWQGAWGEGEEFEEYAELCRLGGEERSVKVLLDDGKTRTVTVSSGKQLWLQPLHQLLYDHLAREKWLVRGEVTRKQLERMAKGHGVMVSGDYEAATDNFCPEHSRWLMELISTRCRYVPDGVLKLAESRFVGGFLIGKAGSAMRCKGQMMGDYLSFPFLCLVNYLTAWRALGENRTLMINGDDIAFRAPNDRIRRWEELVEEGGLVLSKGKTLKSDWMFSLNSMFWVQSGSRMKKLRVVRAKTFLKESERGMWARLDEVTKGWSGRSKEIMCRSFLEWRAHQKKNWTPVEGGIVELVRRTGAKGGVWKRSVPAKVRSKIVDMYERCALEGERGGGRVFEEGDPRSLYEMRPLEYWEEREPGGRFDWPGLYHGYQKGKMKEKKVIYFKPLEIVVKLKGFKRGRPIRVQKVKKRRDMGWIKIENPEHGIPAVINGEESNECGDRQGSVHAEGSSVPPWAAV